MRILKTVRVRHPKDFSNIMISVSGHRDVFIIQPDGDNNIAVTIVTSEVMPIEAFKAILENDFGTIKHWDNYIDPEDGHEVMRGMVIHGGVQKCFYQRYDEFTRKMASDIIKSLELTKRMEDL